MAWEFVEHYAKIILPILVGITTINSVRQLKLLAWVILLSQAYPAFELNLSYLRGYNQLREEGFGGMDNNSYAISLVTCSGLAFFLFLHSERWWQKAIAAASAAVHGPRGALQLLPGWDAGLIVLGLTTFAIMPKGRKECLAFLVVVVLGLALAGPQVRERFADCVRRRGASRCLGPEPPRALGGLLGYHAQATPCLASGPTTCRLCMRTVRIQMRGKEAHTLWLQLGAELGFPGCSC